MIDNDVITQAISESIQISIKNCFDVFEPYIIQILLSALILLFIKSLINKVIDFVCIGYSEKENKLFYINIPPFFNHFSVTM